MICTYCTGPTATPPFCPRCAELHRARLAEDNQRLGEAKGVVVVDWYWRQDTMLALAAYDTAQREAA